MQAFIVQVKQYNQKLHLMPLANTSEASKLTGMSPDWYSHETAGRVSGQLRNRSKMFLQSEPEPLACWPDLFLIFAGWDATIQNDN
jgi:hypothetical protein